MYACIYVCIYTYICFIPFGSDLIKSRLSYSSLYPWCLASTGPEKNVGSSMYVACAGHCNPQRETGSSFVVARVGGQGHLGEGGWRVAARRVLFPSRVLKMFWN